MSDRVDLKVLKWLGHVERMSGEQLTKRVCAFKVEGRRYRGRLCTGWIAVEGLCGRYKSQCKCVRCYENAFHAKH